MPRVSVIIPSFNYGRYLMQAVNSVLDQTFSEFEVIVVDDGSTDETRDVVSRIKDSRVRYIYQDNHGASAARNTGIRVSQSEYLAFLDADDRFLPQKLATQVGAIERDPGIGLVAGGWVEVDEGGNLRRTLTPWTLFPRLNALRLVQSCPFIPTAVLVRRYWVNRVGMFDETIKGAEDLDLWVRLAVAGCRMEWDNQVLCVYRLHTRNKSRDARLAGDSTLHVLDKLYSRADLPVEVLSAKDSAYEVAYVGKTARLYLAGQFSEARAEVQRIVELYPLLLQGNPAEIVKSICDWSYHPFVKDRLRFVKDVQSNFPNILPNPANHFRRVVAQMWIETAFQAHSAGNMGMVQRALFYGILRDRSWLHDRGVWSIGARAFLGCRLSGWLKTIAGRRQRNGESR